MTSITMPAYAKVNWTLDVLACRPDGYHDIRSVMQTIALCDTLTVTHTPNVPGVCLTRDGDEASGVPDGPDNIVHKAAVRLQKTAAARGLLPGDRSGLHIHLVKRIPSQAGLGGGSSDAAATLRAIDILFGLDLSMRRLTGMAAALGADVPFFLHGGTALVEGLGERVTSLPPLSSPCHLVVVKPAVGVSTAEAYAALDADSGRIPGTATAEWLARPSCAPRGNDFEDVVLPALPAVRAAYDLLLQTKVNGEGFKPMLCGSGAAVFCLVSNNQAAEALAAQVREAGVGKAWVTRTQEGVVDG